MSTTQRPSNHCICILITTYKRNDALGRLGGQCQDLIHKYRGSNSYELCITDSDPDNPIAPDISVKYVRNPGKGFDDNLYYFWRDQIGAYDYVFTISDDDLFAAWLNPLYLLDGAIEMGGDVVLFNHRGYTFLQDGSISLGTTFYPSVDLLFNATQLLHEILTVVPRHVGTLYSSVMLRAEIHRIADFRHTLHLYAAPIILAALKGTLRFSDCVICLYETGRKTDGAWTEAEDILIGLSIFLKRLKDMLPQDLYEIAEKGFFYNYLGSNSLLRTEMVQKELLTSEQEIRAMLDGPGLVAASAAI